MKRVRTTTPSDVIKIDHVGTSAPSNPWTGMIWFDTNTIPATLKYYNGSSWATIAISGSLSTDEILAYCFFFGGD